MGLWGLLCPVRVEWALSVDFGVVYRVDHPCTVPIRYLHPPMLPLLPRVHCSVHLSVHREEAAADGAEEVAAPSAATTAAAADAGRRSRRRPICPRHRIERSTEGRAGGVVEGTTAAQ